MTSEKINWPLMKNNITQEDLDVLMGYLQTSPNLAHGGDQVRLFEEEWSKWLGVKYSVFVNSGASANLITIAAMKHLYGKKREIILTWAAIKYFIFRKAGARVYYFFTVIRTAALTGSPSGMN